MELRSFVLAVSVLSLDFASARGEIVYRVHDRNGLSLDDDALDLNRDGAVDFVINVDVIATDSIPPDIYFYYSLSGPSRFAAHANGAIRDAEAVAPLDAGAPIGPASIGWVDGFSELSILQRWFLGATLQAGWTGAWADEIAGLMGVRFSLADGQHYGWIQMSIEHRTVDGFIGKSPRVLDWAYESTPNTAIVAGAVPEPASWVLLAASVAMIAGWKLRRRLLPFLVCTLIPAVASAEIVHRTNPNPDERRIDVDRNGTPDFQFWSMPDISLSIDHIAGWFAYVDGFSSSGMLVSEASAARILSETGIGPIAPTDASWQHSFASLHLSTYRDHAGWSGDWGHAGEGMIGVSFQSDLGLHYGWIRLNLNNQFVPAEDTSGPLQGHLRLGPIIQDWAYESTPDTPIVAGAVPEPGACVLAAVAMLVGGMMWRFQTRRGAAGACVPTQSVGTRKPVVTHDG